MFNSYYNFRMATSKNSSWSEEEFDLEYDPSIHSKLGQANLDIEQAINELVANSIDSWLSKI